jgi:hypothetical protein
MKIHFLYGLAFYAKSFIRKRSERTWCVLVNIQYDACFNLRLRMQKRMGESITKMIEGFSKNQLVAYFLIYGCDILL